MAGGRGQVARPTSLPTGAGAYAAMGGLAPYSLGLPSSLPAYGVQSYQYQRPTAPVWTAPPVDPNVFNPDAWEMDDRGNPNMRVWGASTNVGPPPIAPTGWQWSSEPSPYFQDPEGAYRLTETPDYSEWRD